MLTKAAFSSWLGHWFYLWVHWPFWWLVFIFLWKLSADVALHVISISLLTMCVCASVCCALAPPNTNRQLHKRPDPDPGLFWSPRDSQRCATHWKFWAAKRATSFKPACLLLFPLLLLFCIVALCCSQWQWQCERGTRKMVFSKQIGCQEGGTTSKANRKFITKQTKVLNTRQYTIYIYIYLYTNTYANIYIKIYTTIAAYWPIVAPPLPWCATRKSRATCPRIICATRR